MFILIFILDFIFAIYCIENNSIIETFKRAIKILNKCMLQFLIVGVILAVVWYVLFIITVSFDKFSESYWSYMLIYTVTSIFFFSIFMAFSFVVTSIIYHRYSGNNNFYNNQYNYPYGDQSPLAP
jgi:hypothetical protein